MGERYDPVTGELVSEVQGAETGGTEQASQEPVITEMSGMAAPGPAMHFNPASGEPAMAMGNAPSINFMEPPKKPEGNKNKLWIGVGIMVAALTVMISAAVAAAVKSGAFVNNSGKVLLALGNTMTYRSHLAEDLAPFLVLAGDDYTLGMEMEMPDENAKLEIEYRSGASEKQLEGGIDIAYLPTIHFIAAVTPDEVKIHIPFLDKRIFTYNYTEEKTGYLTELFTEYELEKLDAFLETLFLEQKEESLGEILSGSILKWYQSFELEKVAAGEFEVNGKERKCAGYRFTVAAEDMMELIEEMEDVVFGNYPEEIYNPYEDFFDDMWYISSEMQDLDVTFYLYRNRVECIHVEGAGEELDILLESDKGGNLYMEFVFMDETIMEIERSITDSVEACNIYGYDYDEFSLEMRYDFKSGDYTIDMENDYDEYSLKGNVQSNAKNASVSMEITNDYGAERGFLISVELDFLISVEKGASMETLEGEKVDLGNLPEDDWYGLLDDLWWW